MKDKLMDGLLNFAGKLQANRFMSSIKNGFTDLMPVIITGSFCTLISNVVLSVNPGYLSVANIPGMAWLNVLTPIFTAANYGTMNMLAIGICILIAMHLAETYGNHDRVVPIVALASFISLCSTSTTVKDAAGADIVVNNVLPSTVTNAQGLFVAMLTSIFSTMLFCKLVASGKLEIKLPESVPSNVARSFSVLFPAALSILAISAFGFAFKMLTGMTLFDAIKTFLQAPLQGVMTGLPGYLAYVMFANILWMFGIHGTQTLSAVASPILLSAFAENEAAYLANQPIPNIICTPFASMYNTLTGAGITGGMIIAIMLFSKREDYRQIAKLSIPCGIFNINEPMTFGIPIVLNPMFAVPFLLAPVLGATIGYFLTKIGFCGRGVVNAPWTTPPIIAAFLDTGGSVGAALTQVLILAVSTLLYTPFIIAANSQTGEE